MIFRASAIEFEDFQPHVLKIVTTHERHDTNILQQWFDGNAHGRLNETRHDSTERALMVANGLIVLEAFIVAVSVGECVRILMVTNERNPWILGSSPSGLATENSTSSR